MHGLHGPGAASCHVQADAVHAHVHIAGDVHQRRWIRRGGAAALPAPSGKAERMARAPFDTGQRAPGGPMRGCQQMRHGLSERLARAFTRQPLFSPK